MELSSLVGATGVGRDETQFTCMCDRRRRGWDGEVVVEIGEQRMIWMNDITN